VLRSPGVFNSDGGLILLQGNPRIELFSHRESLSAGLGRSGESVRYLVIVAGDMSYICCEFGDGAQLPPLAVRLRL
jgi:hypothetical protein